MKQSNNGIDGLGSSLSPSARPVAIDSSSFFLTASKSEHKDSILGGQLLEGNVLPNPNPIFLKLPELLIKSKVADDEKLELSHASRTVMSEKSSTESDQYDSDVDSPCWRGHSHKTFGSNVKSLAPRHSTDDHCGFHRLNPLAPQFIPSSSKKNLDMDGEKCEENSSSSLKKSLSSTFPSSSGEVNSGDPLEDGSDDAARRANILTHNSGENFGFISQENVSKTLSMSVSRNESQPSKRLDPLAPAFVPSSAKLSPLHEKQGAFDINAHSTFSQTASDDKPLNKIKVVACSGDVDRTLKSRYGVHELGSTSSYNPCSELEVGISEYAKLGSSSNNSHGQHRLNPLAPQFSLADNKLKAEVAYEKNQAADDLWLVVNTAGLSSPTGSLDHYVGDAKSSVYVERLLPNISHTTSSLIPPQGDSNFGSTKCFAMEPKTSLSAKGNKDFKHPLPFHLGETAASSSTSNLKAFSALSPKMDVKEVITTMHGLSEQLTLADGSESSDSPNAEYLDLINSTVHNLKLYIKNNIQKQAGDQSVAGRNSYNLKLLPNKSKLSIRDLQLPTSNNMTVNLDVKKEKYAMVSGDSRLSEYGTTKNSSFGQGLAKSAYQQNHQGEEQINPRVMLYKSFLLKAEAERCLIVYETSLSNPTS